MNSSSITTVNPATEQMIRTFTPMDRDEIDAALDEASTAGQLWSRTSQSERSEKLLKLAEILRSRSGSLAELVTLEMGKPISEALAEVEKCATACEYYAEHGPAMIEPEVVATAAHAAYIEFSPLGVILAVMPWNYPYWQVVRVLAPALIVGNAVAVKHAENTTGASLALVDAVTAAGIPRGLLTPLVVSVTDVASIIEDSRIAAVTVTGSTGAGRAVAAVAGASLKKSVLELGGSDPFIVLADADLEAAADWAVRSRFQNAGQSCIAAKRLIIEDSVADEFTKHLLARVRLLRVGDPRNRDTTIGPLAREDLLEALVRQVEESIAMGAVALIGGQRLNGPGWYYEPTILDSVRPGMPVIEEEVFGPAFPILRVSGVDAAVELANRSEFGLGGAVWTRDLDKARSVASQLAAGYTAVNGMTASDPRLPFGGVRNSGYGRELSYFGLREFANIHTVVMNE